MEVHERFKTAKLADLEIDVSALYLIADPKTPEEVRMSFQAAKRHNHAMQPEPDSDVCCFLRKLDERLETAPAGSAARHMLLAAAEAIRWAAFGKRDTAWPARFLEQADRLISETRKN